MSGAAKYDRLIGDLRAPWRPQREWSEGRGLFLVCGHFLVGVAAGGWLFGLLFAMPGALVASFALAVLGGLAHLAFLGRPSRVLGMIKRLRSSWISRGFLGLTLFLAGGVLYLVPVAAPGALWGADSAVAWTGYALALAGMAVLIVYMGFVYSASKGIPFWNSPLHPLLYMSYAGRGGAALAMVTVALGGGPREASAGLIAVWMAITALVIVLWLLDLFSAATGSEAAARRSVRELVAGRVAVYFYGGTLLVGLVVPVLLIGGFGAAASMPALAAIGTASVVGDFFIKLSSIKAGVYRPLRLHRSWRGA